MSELKVDENGTPYLEIPWTLKRNGTRMQVVVPGMELEDFKNEPLARAIIKFDTVLQLAQALKCDRSAVARTLSLVNLCPEVVKAVFEGTAPESLTLTKVIYGFPDDWEEQRRVLGLE